ncbi:3'-5' exonuclease [Streptococcus cuniculipharyngis]|uniref:3'-5' exonuclease n=1 Tax=Streptococcus cuniculipharyngis TaxID=1562651 RepID=A0A5C5SEE5_9STRE|nr:3'-5' exonuclease [Streptococcus cuniculipharyngis]TWS98215.1 3'-5' exonuclease [Streptococcus cuniculipharyngis]
MERLRDYIAFDLEFNTVAGVSHIIQLSAVAMQEGHEVAQFDSYVYSSVPLQSFINGLTGITQEKINQAPPIEQVLADFVQFIGERPLIGYNAGKSDLPILVDNGLDLTSSYRHDVYEEAFERRSRDLNGIANLKLQTVADFLGIQGKGHDSLEDARMTALVYEKFLELDDNKDLLQKQENVTNNPFANLDLAAFFDQ